MRLLDRYLLREFLIPLGYCLGGFLIFWIAFDLFSELHGMQEKHLLARDIAEYYVFKAPEFFILVLPIALLLALLYALTNHVRHNEITAIRSAGVSLLRICLPYLALGFLASVLLFALDEFCVPQTAEIAQQILYRRDQRRLTSRERQQVRNLEFSNFRDGRLWHASVYDVRTGEMLNPRIEWHRTDGSWLTIYADRGIRTNGVWTFWNVRQYLMTPTNSVGPSRLPDLAVKSFAQFSETRRMIKSEINITDLLAIRSTRRADIPVWELLNYLRLNPGLRGRDRAWIETKLQGRLAGPWACLVVVLVAIPFATASGRRNVFVSVAASIFFCFAYFTLQQFGFAFGAADFIPAWLGAWFPGLFFVTIALAMLPRVR